MMKRYIFAVLTVVALCTACEKEIEIDYRSVVPLYVVEGRITNEKTEVLITHTRDMGDSTKVGGQDHATITLTGSNGQTEVLQYESDGYYRPATHQTGEPGQTYALSVTIDGNEYLSHSTMHEEVPVEKARFRWLKVMNEKVLFLTLEFRDIAGQENYYCYRVYRNGEPYRWNVLHDRGNDGKSIILDIFCMSEQMAKDNKEEDWDDILYEGDQIEIELQTIDLRTYDYLYSLGLSKRTGSNPVDNFSGGCLGYFAAYSTVRQQTTFHFEGIEE